MHVMTRYLDTRKAAIAALQDFPLMEHAAENTSHLADDLRADLTSPASPNLSGMPRVSNPRAGENRIAATLDKIDLIAQRQREAREYMAWFLPAWGLLTDDERFVLEAFYLGSGSQDDAVQRVSDRFYVERSTAHQKKSRALGRLAVALFGRMGI